MLIIDRLCCRLLSTNIHTQQDCTKDTQLHRKKSAHNEEHLPACMHAYAHTFTGVTQPYFAPCKDVRWCSFFTSASATVITHTRILCTVFLCPLFCLPSCPEGYTTKHMYFHCAIMGLFWGHCENETGSCLKPLHLHTKSNRSATFKTDQAIENA